MRKVRQLLRLARDARRSMRQVLRSCGVSRTTVSELLSRASQAGLSWPLPGEWDDATLEDRLYTQHRQPRVEVRPLPDFQVLHRELHRKGVTLQLPWMEYKPGQPGWLPVQPVLRGLPAVGPDH
ncbi:MAG TPA: hypothetical protein DCM14_03845 [Clostridiales bacterium UBA8153]|nr:hypothetical protein [Clostridiales bacterium UBA8153]